MDKNRILRPMRSDELAQHSEVTWFARGGKCGSPEENAGKQRVLTWGDPAGRFGGKSAEAIVVSSNEP